MDEFIRKNIIKEKVIMFWNWKKRITPFDEGFLDVGDGHKIHYIQVGNPKGEVVLRFHGGPGGELKIPKDNAIDLKKYRLVLFSQRGCGLSKFDDLLKNNTTNHLVEDAKKLLTYLKINEKIILYGGSFGSTLALLFAIKYKKNVKLMLLNAIFLGRKKDIDWPETEMARLYPDLIETMKNLAGKDGLRKYFKEKIHSEKYKDIQEALKYYGSYEYNLGKLNPDFSETPAITDKAINSLKIYLKYNENNMFLEENEIMNNIKKIKDIPTLIVHNRLDLTCPVDAAWELHKKLPQSKLIINPDIGHWSKNLKERLRKEINIFLNKVKV